jgi:preprotein translocase subunit SecG
MSLLLGFLTFILVMNCLFLMLLILIQLPKKEAGAGIAFGGAATDALFGAGSGNALTKMTKYTATLFVAMSVVLSMLNMHEANAGKTRLEQALQKRANASAPVSSPNAAASKVAPPKTPTAPPANLTLQIPTNLTTAPANSSTSAAKPLAEEPSKTPAAPAK